MREDNRAVIRAASAASKAADYLLAFRDGKPLQSGRCATLPSPELSPCAAVQA
jgi:antirestriction protein ArdC